MISTNYGAFEGEAEVARYRISDEANDVVPQVLVQVHSHVSFRIAFEKDGPGDGRPVVTTLKVIGERVARLAAAFFVKVIKAPNDLEVRHSEDSKQPRVASNRQATNDLTSPPVRIVQSRWR